MRQVEWHRDNEFSLLPSQMYIWGGFIFYFYEAYASEWRKRVKEKKKKG